MSVGFPIPYLHHLEPFLEDASCSALARVNKTHMFLCYARAKRLFGWGQSKFSRHSIDTFIFPNDAFLQMQLAKQLLMNEGEPARESIVKEIHDLQTAIDANKLDDFFERCFTVAVPLKITYDVYKSKIAFTPPRQIWEHLSNSKTGVTTTRMFHALNILFENAVAKCAFAAMSNRPSLYKANIEMAGKRVFFQEAMMGIVDQYSDTTIILAEANRMEQEELRNYLVEILERLLDMPYLFFEHPILAWEWKELLPLDSCFYALFRLPDYVNRSMQFVEALHFEANDTDLVNIFTEDEFSTLCHDFDDCVQEKRWSFKDLEQYIKFPVTRKIAVERCFKLLQYFWEQKMETEYNKMLALLKRAK